MEAANVGKSAPKPEFLDEAAEQGDGRLKEEGEAQSGAESEEVIDNSCNCVGSSGAFSFPVESLSGFHPGDRDHPRAGARRMVCVRGKQSWRRDEKGDGTLVREGVFGEADVPDSSVSSVLPFVC